MKQRRLNRTARRLSRHGLAYALSLILAFAAPQAPDGEGTTSPSQAASLIEDGNQTYPGSLTVLADADVLWPDVWMRVTPGDGVHGNIGKPAHLEDSSYGDWNRLFSVSIPVDNNTIYTCHEWTQLEAVTVQVLQYTTSGNNTLYEGVLAEVPVCL